MNENPIRTTPHDLKRACAERAGKVLYHLHVAGTFAAASILSSS